jgi:hypothetical protein
MTAINSAATEAASRSALRTGMASFGISRSSHGPNRIARDITVNPAE